MNSQDSGALVFVVVRHTDGVQHRIPLGRGPEVLQDLRGGTLCPLAQASEKQG